MIVAEKDEYLIEVIDSNEIKLISNGFEGFFRGFHIEDKNYFNESVERFFLGDSLKAKIVGTWTYKSHEIEFAEHMTAFKGDLEMEKYLKHIRGFTIKEGFTISISADNKLVMKDRVAAPKEFGVIIDEKLTMRYSDIVMYLGYEIISDDELKIEYKKNIGSNYISMTKVR